MSPLVVRLRSLLIWLVALPVFVAACLVVWLGSFVVRGRCSRGRSSGPGCRKRGGWPASHP